jgi:rhodanese-related sulfurtransferase
MEGIPRRNGVSCARAGRMARGAAGNVRGSGDPRRRTTMAYEQAAIPKLHHEELWQKFQHGEAFILVDVLSHEHFQQMHLPGAVNVPLNRMRELAPVLFTPQDQIIVYCANPACTASPTAVRTLRQIGFPNVWDFEDGLQGWEAAGHPVVRAPEEEQRAA